MFKLNDNLDTDEKILGIIVPWCHKIICDSIMHSDSKIFNRSLFRPVCTHGILKIKINNDNLINYLEKKGWINYNIDIQNNFALFKVH